MQMGTEQDNESTKPFLQRIQLKGPQNVIVRATGQIDDGASKNCISKNRWDRYGHCLSPLGPSTTLIKVANDAQIRSMGRWHGGVTVGGTETQSTFEVFDCKNAFDVILGKPWLKQVKAIHDYSTDTITIKDGEERVELTNIDIPITPSVMAITTEPEPTTPTSPRPSRSRIPPDEYEEKKRLRAKLAACQLEHERQTRNAAAKMKHNRIRRAAQLGRQEDEACDIELEAEYTRINMLRLSDEPWAETKWATFLNLNENCERNLEQQRQQQITKDIDDAHETARTTLPTQGCRPQNYEDIKKRRKDTTQDAAASWRFHRQTRQIGALFGINTTTITNQDQLAALVQSEARIHQLQDRLNTLRHMARAQPSEDTNGATNDETTPVHILGDVNTEKFKIDRGNNDSPRIQEPFAKKRIAEILEKIEIGNDLTQDQRERVETLVSEYADIFALSLSEVLYVDWYTHKLNFDPETKFTTKINQRPVTEAQKGWFNEILDDMEKAHVIQRVPGEFIKNLSSTNLAPKDAGKTGLTRTEVLREVNAECIRNGLPPFWEEVILPGETNEALLEAVEGKAPHETKTKWRVCHAFNALNKATQVPPFPVGDLKRKHEFAAGHRWASVIDFAAGYYAVPLDDDSVPYVAFYVEGRGYYVYLRMPFGLTGAPTTFCEMVAIALDDMIGRELVNWMDDICIPGDVFETKLQNLRRFFDRCRSRNLSLSPSKTKLFFTEVLFAGAMVGPQGIRPNLDKVGAVVKWPVPETVQQLMGFLGLTNFFRRLITNYARIAAPLSDLTRDVKIEQPSGNWRTRKGAYKRALASSSLKDKWGDEQQKAFVTLKCLLSEEPLLKPPQYDGRPFRVTTDGCMNGFAGFISQAFTTTGTDGKETTRWHPISFCSKRTSKSEAKYEPFLLEFAALKYSLDEFAPYIYGAPIELETDCQALRDCLVQEKMSVHHSRWKESILAHNIIAIRHRPGIENPVADGLSRMWEGRPRTDTDGSHYTVLADWEANKGISNDILSISDTQNALRHPLETHFANDIFFTPIIHHLLGKTAGDTPSDKRKAAHRAKDFMIAENKLWKVSNKASDRVARTECIPVDLGFNTALRTHIENGCFGPEHIQLHLRDKYFWPGMLTDCRQAQLECPKCKSFGAPTRNSALQPIRRTHPFQLIAGDYLSLPLGKGGYKTVGLYIDTYSGFVWGSKLKQAGTGKSTINSLKNICMGYASPSTFMADGGSHFDNNEVDTFCEENNILHITTPAYAPWVNGLIENANQLLLGRLKKLCAPNHDEDEDDPTKDSKSIPTNWPEHFDEAIRQLNDRIAPALNATARELLFALPFRKDDSLPLIPNPTTPTDTHTNFTLAETFRSNAHLASLYEADRRKETFDSNSPITKFKIGDLIQVYDSASDFNFKSINKLTPKWSEPRIIFAEFSNSFSLCTLTGLPLKGITHSRRMRHYIPLRGTLLDTLYPRENENTTQNDLDIAEAEARMTDEFTDTELIPGNTP